VRRVVERGKMSAESIENEVDDSRKAAEACIVETQKKSRPRSVEPSRSRRNRCHGIRYRNNEVK
jgi:hypothetical protein